jgi:hypothetical protein
MVVSPARVLARISCLGTRRGSRQGGALYVICWLRSPGRDSRSPGHMRQREHVSADSDGGPDRTGLSRCVEVSVAGYPEVVRTELIIAPELTIVSPSYGSSEFFPSGGTIRTRCVC